MVKHLSSRYVLILFLISILSPLLFNGCIEKKNNTQPVSPLPNIQTNSENMSEVLSGFEIPQGAMPQREATYDDIIGIPGGAAYRGGGGEGTISELKAVESTEVSLGDGFFVDYRDNIETEAGQIRYNIVSTRIQGGGSWMNSKVNVKLANLPNPIQVKKISEGGGLWYSIVLMIEISPQLKPSDYKLGFFIFINGKYYGDLPCVIHVVE